MSVSSTRADAGHGVGSDLDREPNRLALDTFEFFIDDSRYSVPTLNLLPLRDEAAARDMADRMMRENPHYRGLEVWLGDSRLWGLGSYADAGSRASPPSVE